ncbi:MAG: hypothetical protein GF347_03850 [Candidatus Moranbacteria bacterium]|nr:hypothetical protein [Candidatus Moranbacteria bacterium]
MKTKKQKFNQGYVVLISVLIVSAIGITVAVSILLSSINASQSNQIMTDAAQARAYADSCVEEALSQLKGNQSFSGTGSLVFPDSSTCEYEVINLGGENTRINSVGYHRDTVQRFEVYLDNVTPSINIVSWKPVADFN